MTKRVLAFDFGASSGRAIIGHFDGENIRLEEVHRFSNDPVSMNGTLYWDVLRLFFEIKQGLTKAKLAGGANHKLRIGQAGGIQVRGNHVIVDSGMAGNG